MSDKLTNIIIKNAKEINNLKEQRSSLGGTVDKFTIFLDNVSVSSVLKIDYDSIMSDEVALTDTLSIGPNVNIIETIFSFSSHDGAGFMRLDYGMLDYDRLSFLKSEPEDEVIVTVV